VRIAVVGSGRSVHTAARSAALAARGHQVRLVTFGEVTPVEGIDVRTRPIPRGALAAVRAVRAFLDDVRSFDPDLLHLHYAGGKLGTLASLAGIHPFVVTVMGGDVLPEQHPRGLAPLERRATRRILHQADLILVKADALRSAVTTFGGASGRIETVRWGVDPERFRHDPALGEALRRRLGLGPRDRVVVSPRILQPLYNVDLIVDAMSVVLARVPDAVLLITEYNADPAYRQVVATRIVTRGLGHRVRLVGRIDHGEMPALYSLAEVMVSVPASDGLPQSLFEAMACEVPVVLGPVPAYAEVVGDGAVALTVDLDAGSVGRAVARLLEDRDLRLRLSRAALARVRDVALLPREVERVERFYRALLDAPRRPVTRRGRVLDLLSLAFR
jgi:glycosyltransferase involved in cell wall biosynthesis